MGSVGHSGRSKVVLQNCCMPLSVCSCILPSDYGINSHGAEIRPARLCRSHCHPLPLACVNWTKHELDISRALHFSNVLR